MKKLLLLFALASFTFVGCDDDDTEGVDETSAMTQMDDADDHDHAQDELSTDVIQNTNESATADPANAPQITFEHLVYDFGKIKQGEKVEHVFKFTNTGKSDLIISNAQASCGCTVPTWPKHPIKPGETGEIPVIFDSSGKENQVDKTITITSNTNPATTVLTIKTFIQKS